MKAHTMKQRSGRRGFFSGFHAYAGEEIPDIEDALRVELHLVDKELES
jgi:hypothetical protein